MPSLVGSEMCIRDRHTTVYITHPWGGFPRSIARQPRGCLHRTTRLRKALGKMFPTPIFFAPTLFQLLNRPVTHESQQSSAWAKGSLHVFFSLVSCCRYQLILYVCSSSIATAATAHAERRPATTAAASKQQQQQASSSSSGSSSRHARRRQAAAHTDGRSCRWHRRRGSYSRQSGETARRDQCSNCKREYGPQNCTGET